MKRLSLLVLLAFALVNCKNDDPDALPELESIVGKWRPVEHTKSGGTPVVVTNGDIDFMEIRYDGVLLNKGGYRPCCSPTSYMLNGVPFEIVPQAPAELDPICASVSCVPCADLKITQISQDVIVTEYCGHYSTKFEREK